MNNNQDTVEVRIPVNVADTIVKAANCGFPPKFKTYKKGAISNTSDTMYDTWKELYDAIKIIAKALEEKEKTG